MNDDKRTCRGEITCKGMDKPLMRENIVSKPCSKGMQDDNVS